jgi:hypothetical protein
MHLCTYVSEEGDDGESARSETPSLLSYTLRYFSFIEVDRVSRVALREPMHLCTSVSEEGVDGEAAHSETSSLLSYTLRYVSFEEVGRVCRVALREPMQDFPFGYRSETDTPGLDFVFGKGLNLINLLREHDVGFRQDVHDLTEKKIEVLSQSFEMLNL